MRPVSGAATPFDLAVGRAARPEPARSKPGGESRALVSVLPPGREDRRPCGRPAAAFVTQLIATREQLPQTRDCRRAEPSEAIAAYEARRPVLPFSGRVLAQSA